MPRTVKKTIYPRSQDILAVVAEPNLLIVKMQTCIFTVLFIVARGPRSGRPAAEVKDHWEHVTATVHKVSNGTERRAMFTDANSHLHRDSDDDVVEHAKHFISSLDELEMQANTREEPLATYSYSEENFVQDDYIPAGKGVLASTVGPRVATFAHLIEHGQREPVLLEVSIQAGKVDVPVARRQPSFDKLKQQDQYVLQRVRSALTAVDIPGIEIEQTSRAFIADQAIVKVLEQETPKSLRPPRQHWTSPAALAIIEQRNQVHKEVRRKGRTLKRLVAYPIAAGTVDIAQAFQLAARSRDDRDAVEHAPKHLQVAVKSTVKNDIAANVVKTSSRLVGASEFGLCPAMHRTVKPLRRKGACSRLLLHDSEGRQTVGRADEGTAIKQILVLRGQGTSMPYTELFESARKRSRSDWHTSVDSEAVVGIIDTRRRAARATQGQAHGPTGLPSDVDRLAAPAVSRLYDGIKVEATLSAELPLGWHGGDNTMLLKSQLKSTQDVMNRVSILLADQRPKVAGGEIRATMAQALSKRFVYSQSGDGFGACSCELAHLGLEGCSSLTRSSSSCLMHIFIDVVQAFPSIVVALSLPLPTRSECATRLLTEAGFDQGMVSRVFEEDTEAEDWAYTSEHVKRLLAAFQEDQWISQDSAQ